MKKINEKIFVGIIANIVLVVLIVFVSAVTIFPKNYVPIWSSTNENVYYRGNLDKKQVSLMINVYWGREEVLKMLDILKSNDVKATFFIGGCFADDNADLIKKINKEGHELANHGYFHKDATKLDLKKNKEEIEITENLIKNICGVKTTLFAPPSGAYNKQVVSICKTLNYKVIMWSKDTIDWRDKDEELCYKRAIKNAQNGDLILMHPMKHTVSVLSKIIDFYKKNGYNLVTVSSNIT